MENEMNTDVIAFIPSDGRIAASQTIIWYNRNDYMKGVTDFLRWLFPYGSVPNGNICLYRNVKKNLLCFSCEPLASIVLLKALSDYSKTQQDAQTAMLLVSNGMDPFDKVEEMPSLMREMVDNFKNKCLTTECNKKWRPAREKTCLGISVKVEDLAFLKTRPELQDFEKTHLTKMLKSNVLDVSVLSIPCIREFLKENNEASFLFEREKALDESKKKADTNGVIMEKHAIVSVVSALKKFGDSTFFSSPEICEKISDVNKKLEDLDDKEGNVTSPLNIEQAVHCLSLSSVNSTEKIDAIRIFDCKQLEDFILSRLSEYKKDILTILPYLLNRGCFSDCELSSQNILPFMRSEELDRYKSVYGLFLEYFNGLIEYYDGRLNNGNEDEMEYFQKALGAVSSKRDELKTVLDKIQAGEYMVIREPSPDLGVYSLYGGVRESDKEATRLFVSVCESVKRAESNNMKIVGWIWNSDFIAGLEKNMAGIGEKSVIANLDNWKMRENDFPCAVYSMKNEKGLNYLTEQQYSWFHEKISSPKPENIIGFFNLLKIEDFSAFAGLMDDKGFVKDPVFISMRASRDKIIMQIGIKIFYGINVKYNETAKRGYMFLKNCVDMLKVVSNIDTDENDNDSMIDAKPKMKHQKAKNEDKGNQENKNSDSVEPTQKEESPEDMKTNQADSLQGNENTADDSEQKKAEEVIENIPGQQSENQLTQEQQQEQPAQETMGTGEITTEDENYHCDDNNEDYDNSVSNSEKSPMTFDKKTLENPADPHIQ